MMRVRLLLIWLLCLPASLYAAFRMLYCIVVRPAKAWTLAVAHDQLMNAACNGDEDETISSRAYRGAMAGSAGWAALRGLLDRIEPDHCLKAYEAELGRKTAAFRGKINAT